MCVTAALVAFVALQFGQGEANPKGALAVIFTIIGAFVLALLVLQSRDLSAAGAADARSHRAAVPRIGNPATMEEPELWVALAVHRVGADAVRARRAMWGTARESLQTGMLVCALIFLTVPPIYLLESFVPLIIGGPAIAGVALWKSTRLLAPGGEMDRMYDATDRAMAPLGLAVAEKPRVAIEPKSAAPFRIGPTVKGTLVLKGERHGRPVSVRMPAAGAHSKCEVHVGLGMPEFEFRTRDGRLKAGDGAPQAIRDALIEVPNSTRWNGVSGSGGADGITVERRAVKSGGDWLLDLWLAEKLAAAV